MVKIDPSTGKGEQTRRHIFLSALALFRENGFDNITMQAIAERAEVAKSAAYYYFPSKEAIIQAYYEEVQSEQERTCGELFSEVTDVRKRVASAMHTKFDLAKNDRKLLGVVFRYTGEPEHPLSCLGKGTKAIRRRSIGVFERAIETERMPRDLVELLPLALWSLQMGLLIMFLYDESPNQQRTRKLTDGALDLAWKLYALAKLPVLRPFRTKILALLRAAQFLPVA